MKRIAIVGLGLMGGSLAAACRKKFPKSHVIGISRSKQALQTALRKHWIHEGARDFNEGIKNVNLVILCTPVDTLASLLKQLDQKAASKTLVTDVGSSKEDLIKKIGRKRFRRIQFVSAHPMVGSHERGIGAAKYNLYDHGFTFVIREKGASPSAYRAIRQFWKKISPKVIEVNAKNHDHIVGEISHLPHLLAVALMLSVSGSSLKFAASGFCDTTRIAAGPEGIWSPIFFSNKKQIVLALKKFQKTLQTLEKTMKSQDARKLRILLRRASFLRGQISF